MAPSSIRDQIIFDPVPIEVGPEWHVRAVYPSGHEEHITGFASVAAAKDWIAGDEAKVWLRSRGYPDD
jgi:hypothetical protein